MRRAGVLALTVALAALAATAPVAGAKTAHTCYPGHSRTLVASAHARLVLRSNGSLAFIASTFDDLGAFVAGSQVVAVEHGLAPVVLAGGPGVEPDSLALAGSTIYWTRNAMPFSAQLR